MSTTTLIGVSAAARQYQYRLAAALAATEIYDPGFALRSDPEAYEKALRDPVIAETVEYRQQLVAGRDWRFDPASDSEIDKQAAAVMTDLCMGLEDFAAARFRLAEVFLRGSAWERIQGRRRSMHAGGIWAEWWTPTELVNIDRSRFQLLNLHDPAVGRRRPRWHLWSWSRNKLEPLDHPEWFVRHVYNKAERTLGHGTALLDSLYFFMYAKSIVFQAALNGVERWAEGFLDIAFDATASPRPGKTTSEEMDELIEVVQKSRAQHYAAHDSRHKLSILSGSSEGWQIAKQMLDYIDERIRGRILGATMATGGQPGGSLARAITHENATEAKVQYDRLALEESLHRDLTALVWRLNLPVLALHGLARAGRPQYRITQAEVEDSTARAGIVSTALGAGMELKKTEAYEQLGFTPPSEGDEVVKGGGGAAGGQPGIPGLPMAAEREGSLEFQEAHEGHLTEEGAPHAGHGGPAGEKLRYPEPKPVWSKNQALYNNLGRLRGGLDEDLERAGSNIVERHRAVRAALDRMRGYKDLTGFVRSGEAAKALNPQAQSVERMRSAARALVTGPALGLSPANRARSEGLVRRALTAAMKRLEAENEFETTRAGMAADLTGAVTFRRGHGLKASAIEFVKGQPCKQGESAARSGCIPAKKGKPAEKPKGERKPRDERKANDKAPAPSAVKVPRGMPAGKLERFKTPYDVAQEKAFDASLKAEALARKGNYKQLGKEMAGAMKNAREQTGDAPPVRQVAEQFERAFPKLAARARKVAKNTKAAAGMAKTIASFVGRTFKALHDAIGYVIRESR